MSEHLSNEEAAKQIGELIGEMFEVQSVGSVNFKVDGEPGHPFMVGPGHVAFASDKRGGRLTPEAIDASGAGCYYQEGGHYGGRCSKLQSAHTSDRVVFVKLRRNLGNKEAAQCMMKAKLLLLDEKIDGIVFVETPENYRIAPPEVPSDEEEETQVEGSAATAELQADSEQRAGDSGDENRGVEPG